MFKINIYFWGEESRMKVGFNFSPLAIENELVLIKSPSNPEITRVDLCLNTLKANVEFEGFNSIRPEYGIP